MSNTNRPWTPGPWRFDREHDNEEEFVPHGVGGSVCTGEYPRIGWTLARVWHDGPNPDADAYLIAAAPELFEALAAFVGVCDNGTPTKFIEELGSVVPAARAALAKARGEEVAS